MRLTQPYIAFVYDRYHKATATKRGVLEIRVTYDGKQKYMTTGFRLLPKEWHHGMVVNRPDAQILNQTLQMLINDIRKVLLKMQEEGRIDIFAIPSELDKLRKPKQTFLDYIMKRGEVRKHGRKKDSQERYNRFLRFFEEFGEIKDFTDITDANVKKFDDWCNKKKLKPYSKWNNYHRFLNSFIIDAINDGLLTRNPYKSIHIEKGKTVGIEKYLTPEEYQKICDVELSTKSLERVRDLFVFQANTCLAYTDLAAFSSKKIETVKGKKVYVGRRHKTGETFVVPMLPKALEILAKYKDRLPKISNVKYNKYLKDVAEEAGIAKAITSHWARHTGATLLLNGGVPMHIVSKILGHAKIAITESTYAKTLDESIVDAVVEYEKNAEKRKKQQI